jgi:hypothetical protein
VTVTATVATKQNLTASALAVVGLTTWMTLCDRFFHLGTDTLEHYWEPFIGAGQTFWVIVVFGLASIGIVLTSPRFAVERGSLGRFGLEVLIMTAVYGSSGYFGADHRYAVLAAFIALFVVRLAFSGERGALLAVAILLAVIGPAWESLQWKLGMFAYHHPDVAGVPWWLIPFYANGAWAVRQLGALLKTPLKH